MGKDSIVVFNVTLALLHHLFSSHDLRSFLDDGHSLDSKTFFIAPGVLPKTRNCMETCHLLKEGKEKIPQVYSMCGIK